MKPPSTNTTRGLFVKGVVGLSRLFVPAGPQLRQSCRLLATFGQFQHWRRGLVGAQIQNIPSHPFFSKSLIASRISAAAFALNWFKNVADRTLGF